MSITIALAGNPNSGKTTLFNALTGSNQYVGNWPGVTVEKKEGKLKTNSDVIITDLPGIYSMSPYTMEEVVARNYLVNERPDAILNIVDGTNLERNLYLTTQLKELGIPVVIAINMMDVITKRGDHIDIEQLSKKFGCRIVEISALKESGILEAAEIAIEEAKGRKLIPRHIFSGSVEHALAHIEELTLHDLPEEQQRWYAIKLFERDERVLKKFSFSRDIVEHIEKDIRACEEELDDDAESIITNERYNYIESVIATCYTRKNKNGLTTSDKIDRIVTNKWLGLPVFAAIMFFVYWFSMAGVGKAATDWANDGLFGEGFSFFGAWVPGIPVLVERLLDSLNVSESGAGAVIRGVVLDGIVAGVGSVLGFVPQIFALFLMLAFLEACGYMSRIAFVLDKLFRKFGLSGKSFIPILVGTGCGVPGIMASRTIESEKDRRITIMTTTFIPCGAKVPFIAMIAGALFGGSAWVSTGAYIIGMAAIIVSGIILKKTTVLSGAEAPFVMELPAYHMPPLKNVLRSMWDRGWSFVKKAGTIILLSTIVVWFLSNFGFAGGFRMLSEDELGLSVLAKLASLICVVFKPLGFGTWQATVASITGLVAKENIVGTMGVLYGSQGNLYGTLAETFTHITGMSFMVFNLLCAPCIGAMAAIRREMNSARWTWFAIGYQCCFAYAVSLMINQFGGALTGQVNVIGLIAAFVTLAVMLWLLLRPAKISTEPAGAVLPPEDVSGCESCAYSSTCHGKKTK